jgi:hypothetical protein
MMKILLGALSVLQNGVCTDIDDGAFFDRVVDELVEEQTQEQAHSGR